MVLKKHIFSASGTGGLEFESPHFDQKEKDSPCGCFFLLSLLLLISTPFVLQHKGVRIPSEAVGARSHKASDRNLRIANTSTY